MFMFLCFTLFFPPQKTAGHAVTTTYFKDIQSSSSWRCWIERPLQGCEVLTYRRKPLEWIFFFKSLSCRLTPKLPHTVKNETVHKAFAFKTKELRRIKVNSAKFENKKKTQTNLNSKEPWAPVVLGLSFSFARWRILYILPLHCGLPAIPII